jgi:hypothetical protein
MSTKSQILRKILERLVEVEPEVPAALDVEFPGWEVELNEALDLFENAHENAASFPANFVKKDSIVAGSTFWHYEGMECANTGLYFPYDVFITHGTFQTKDPHPGGLLTMCMHHLDLGVDIPGSEIPIDVSAGHELQEFSNTFVVPAGTRFLLKTVSLQGTADFDCACVTLWFRRKLY